MENSLLSTRAAVALALALGLSAVRFAIAADCDSNGIHYAIDLRPRPFLVEQGPLLGGKFLLFKLFDLDGDGDSDVITSEERFGLEVQWNDGGQWTPQSIPSPSWTQEVYPADVDVDGDTDLVVVHTNKEPERRVSIARRVAPRAFADADFVLVDVADLTRTQFTALDLTGDGLQELIATRSGCSFLATLHLTNEGGTEKLTPVEELLLGPILDCDRAPLAFVAGDMNGDGRLDFVAASTLTRTLAVFLRGSDGHYQRASDYPHGSSYVAAGDLDGDGDLDLASQHEQKVALLHNDGRGAFGAETTILNGEDSGVSIADMDSDGLSDLLYFEKVNDITRSIHILRVLLNRPRGLEVGLELRGG